MNRTIWIVDDELLIGLHLSRVFEEQGYEARSIKSGELCLELIASGEQPDLILMDINLGEGRMDGPETTRRVSAEHDIPVVLHSAYTDRQTLSRTENMVKYGYVQKVPGNEQFVLATVQMALKLHAVELALREREQRYRDLSNHLQRIREEQSAYMAREIHDDLGQSLAALKMNLTMISKVGGSPEIDPYLTDMRDILDQTVKKVRGLVQELRPPVLDSVGIIEALRWHVEEVQNAFNVPISFSTNSEETDLSETSALAAFRIVQEALTNSLRHGEPSSVAVSIEVEARSGESDKAIEITVADDGRGFTETGVAGGTGFGLLSMRERAEQAGGSLKIRTASGQGTTITATIPFGGSE